MRTSGEVSQGLGRVGEWMGERSIRVSDEGLGDSDEVVKG